MIRPAAPSLCKALAARKRCRFARDCSSSGWATMTRISAPCVAVATVLAAGDSVEAMAGQSEVARAPGAANIPAKREGGPHAGDRGREPEGRRRQDDAVDQSRGLPR